MKINPNDPQALAKKCATCNRVDHRRQRGSSLILVVVTLVLMVLMGAAYVQIARVDRLTTAQLTDSNIDQVVAAIIAQLKSTLAKDLFDDGDRLFNPSLSDAGAADEPYDYPWTNVAAVWPVTLLDGSTANAVGGQLDDTHLAWSYQTNGDNWKHITNLNGIFLELPALGNVNRQTPRENVLNNLDNTRRSTDVSHATLANTYSADFEKRGADTDGDGVEDSRWTWAPIKQIGALEYVMAVRMIDSSSMIPINAATALTTDGDIDFGPDRTARGYYPTNLDLTRFLKRQGSGSWVAELGNVLTTRKVSGAFPTVLDLGVTTLPGGRFPSWLKNARLYGYSTDKYGVNDELELRAGNGLNTSRDTPLETDMSILLRQSSTPEASFDVLSGLGAADQAARQRWFEGGTGDDSGRTYIDLRKWLTVRSGAAAFAPNYDNMYTGVLTLKYDLVYEDKTASADTRALNMFEVIQKTFNVGTPFYGGLSASEVNVAAADFAVAIQDYSDNDNIPTGIDGGAFKVYGLEMMPFLREAYIQVGYDHTDDLMPDPCDITMPISGADLLFDTYTPVPGSEAVAVEIGNPFARELSGADLNGVFQVAVVQGGTEKVWTFSGLGNMAPGDKVVIVSNPTTPVTEGTTARSDLVADLSIGGTTVNAGNGVLTFTTGADVTIELRVDVGSGSFVTYDRLTISGFQLPGAADHFASGQLAEADAHGQASVGRDGNNIRYISNVGIALIAAARGPDAGGYRSDGGSSPVDSLADDTKGQGSTINGDTTLDTVQILIANRDIVSVAELGWIHMFGFTDQINGDFPTRLSGKAGLQTKADGAVADTASGIAARQFLDFSSTAIVPTSTKIPHSAMVLEQFTTVALHLDGVDNDNSDGDDVTTTDADNPEEQFVPYLINVNTAPRHVLSLSSPLPETMGRIQNLMDELIRYRDVPTDRAGITGLSGVRTEPGLAALAELMFLNPSSSNDNSMQFYGNDGNNDVTNNINFDLYPLPENYLLNDAIADDAEERMARYQFLSQVYTVRGDIYVSWVEVRGYEATDYTIGAQESARFLIILDRGSMTDSASSVKIVGMSRSQ